jgi:hypothetical protein
VSQLSVPHPTPEYDERRWGAAGTLQIFVYDEACVQISRLKPTRPASAARPRRLGETFTLGLSAIEGESDFSRCPNECHRARGSYHVCEPEELYCVTLAPEG